MIIKTWEEYVINAKCLLLGKPKFVYISSFGMYINITSTGEDISLRGEGYTNSCRRIIDLIPLNTPIKTIVGISDSECYQGCLYCKEKLKKRLSYLKYTGETLPQLHLKVSFQHHMKLFMTDKGAIIGGMNFSESNWFDFSMLIYPKQKEFLEIKKYFEDVHNKTKSIV